MKKYLAIWILGVMLAAMPAEARTVSVIKNAAQPYYNNYNTAYSSDLNTVERFLFRRTYSNENLNSRLNRIEKYLFNKTYTTISTANRMNNIMANYQDDATYTRNYLSNYYDNSTPVSRIRNRIIGQPTGFTPQIINSPFGSNIYSPGFARSNVTNRGYRYNYGVPMNTGVGVHILD